MLGSLLAGVLLALSLLPLPASAAVTTGSSSSPYYLGLRPTKITTSTGKVVVTEASTSTLSGVGLDVTVEKGLGLYGIGELHSWFLPRSSSIFTFSPTTGKGSVSMTSSEEGPFGSTNLRFTTSSKSTTCGEGRYQYKEWKGTLKGTFVFKTGFWGKIGSSSFAKPATVSKETTTRCKLPLPPCHSGVSWSVFTGTSFGFGDVAGSTGSIVGERNVTLSSPAGAGRSDELLSSAPKPTWSGGVMKVSTPGGKITGSATIKAEGTPSTNPPFSCRSGTKTKTETDKFWGKVAYSSPAGHAITFHLSAPTGDVFSLPQQFTGSEGSISVSTVS